MTGQLTTPEERRLKQVQGRKRQAEIGLANNAFGAAAGAYGTRAVWREQEKKYFPERAAARAARAAAKPSTRLARTGQRIWAKIPAQHQKRLAAAAVPASIATAVGSQLVNAGMDAQSAAYFTGEVKDLRAKQRRLEDKVTKSYETPFIGVSVPTSEVGHSLVEISKAKRRFDPEDERFRRLGMYQGAGYLGGALLAGEGARQSYLGHKPKVDAWVKANYTGANSYQKLKSLGSAAKGKLKPTRPMGLVAAGTGLAGLGEVARRRATSERNQRWT